VLSVGNLKGGVGKTTVVANLAIALVRARLRVLAIDLDFQASLSVAFPPNVMPRYESIDGGIQVLISEDYDIFHNTQVTAMGVSPFADLSLVRTSLELADAEDSLFAAFILDEREQDARLALSRKLSDPRLRRDFDIVLIDTPPRLTTASINALCASTHVLIPTSLTSMSRSGAVTFVHYLAKFREKLCPSLNLLGVLPTFTARSTLSSAEEAALTEMQRSLPANAVWRDMFIPLRQAIANNQFQDPSNKALFDRLAQKVISMLGLHPDGHNQGRNDHRSPRLDWGNLSQ
jgi:cellulose biosynthesis protein BcsQ